MELLLRPSKILLPKIPNPTVHPLQVEWSSKFELWRPVDIGISDTLQEWESNKFSNEEMLGLDRIDFWPKKNEFASVGSGDHGEEERHARVSIESLLAPLDNVHPLALTTTTTTSVSEGKRKSLPKVNSPKHRRRLIRAVSDLTHAVSADADELQFDLAVCSEKIRTCSIDRTVSGDWVEGVGRV
jgi:hypothetical protein